jgi:hypothetical protein
LNNFKIISIFRTCSRLNDFNVYTVYKTCPSFAATMGNNSKVRAVVGALCIALFGTDNKN